MGEPFETARRPVSAAFDLSPLSSDSIRERVRKALAIIDGVHTAGALPRIPIDHVVDRDARAQYRMQPNRGRALGIGLDPFEPHIELAIVHEIGHFLDHQAIGNRGGYASNRHPNMDRWRQALVATDAIRGLRALDRMSNDDLAMLLQRPVHFDDRAAIDRLLRYTESWARSYVQYIAARSGDVLLQRQIAAERTVADHIDAPGIWDDSDFIPLHAAIDDLFRQKGWFDGHD
jgi:hypothetical protein